MVDEGLYCILKQVQMYYKYLLGNQQERITWNTQT